MEDYKKVLQAEKTINEIWPFVLEKQVADSNLEEGEKEFKYFKSNYMPGVWITKICVPLTVGCILAYFLSPQQRNIFGDTYRGGVLPMFASIIGLVALIGIFVGVAVRLTFKKGYHTAKNKIPQLEQLATEAGQKLNNVKINKVADLMFVYDVVPENARDPKHVRMLAGYFETNRAQTLAEAIPLLETQMHCEEMERLQREQVALAEKTYNELDRIRRNQ